MTTILDLNAGVFVQYWFESSIHESTGVEVEKIEFMTVDLSTHFIRAEYCQIFRLFRIDAVKYPINRGKHTDKAILIK